MLRLALATAVALLTAAAPAAARGTLEVVPADGGPRTLVAGAADFGSVAWTAGGIAALQHADLNVTRRVFPGPATPDAVLEGAGDDSTLSPDGRFVVTGGDRGVVVLDAATGATVATGKGPERKGFGFGEDEYPPQRCWAADGSRVAVSFEGSGMDERPTTLVLDTRSRRVVRRTRLSLVGYGTCFSPDGTKLITAREPLGVTGILDVASGRFTALRGWGRDGAEEAVWSPDGTKLALLVDGTLVVADAVTGWGLGHPVTTRGALGGERQDTAGGFAWSPDGTRLAYVAIATDLERRSARPTLMVLRVDVPSPPRALVAARRSAILDHAWSPDGQRIAFTTSAEPIRVVTGETHVETVVGP